jgi:predicted transcriptional regulator of viral defense system
MTITDYIRKLQSFEEYSFSLEEAMENSSKDGTAVKREIARLTEKKDIINLRKGFYLIIPPRYATSEKLPLQLYVGKLFKYLNRNYYMGLYSAARIHGASHQQSQRDYLIIEAPKLNPIRKKSFDLQFFTTGNWPESNIEVKRSDAGEYNISSPALTLVDLIHHHTKIGGLNRILSSVEELTEEITEKDILSLMSWYEHKSTLQRAGFLLEEVSGTSPLVEIVFTKLKEQQFYPVLLSPRRNQKPGSANNRWKIDVNIKLDSDL